MMLAALGAILTLAGIVVVVRVRSA